jgi:DNA-binding MarR family transcriptional regulator
MSILTKISRVARNSTTYRVGLLQARVYKILKERTSVVLAPLGVSTTEWAFLGLLKETKAMRPKHIAEELGVEPPFVTFMVTHLKKEKLVEESVDTRDSRAKMLSLTPKGKTFVEKTEKFIRNEMRPLIAGTSPGDLSGYLTVLEKVIENSTTNYY